MSRSLSEDDSFLWERVADEMMKEITAENPFLLERFADAKLCRPRVELLLSDGVAIRAVAARVWNKYDNFAAGKSDDASAEFRSAGNEHFRRKRVDSAAMAYTLAVFKAETDSEAYALALANRSACSFEADRLEECLEDAEMALATTRYPARLRGKLLKRKLECLKRLGRDWKRVKKAFEEMREFTLESVDGAKSDDHDDQLKRLEGEWIRFGKRSNGDRQGGTTTRRNDDDVGVGRSQNVFSPDISVRSSTGDLGRHVVADRDVDRGLTLIEEPAFAHVLIPDHNFLHCQRCLRAKSNLIPCRLCSEVGYCGTECRDLAMIEFHSKECDYAHLLSRIGIAHLGYRIVSQVGVAAVLETHRREVESRANARTFFSASEKTSSYDGVYALMTHERETTSTDSFLYALTAVLMLKMVCDRDDRLKDVFANLALGKSDVVDLREGPHADLVTMAEVLLRHLLQLICNASAITAVVGETGSGRSTTTTVTENQVRIATAIFPRLSLLNHSCDPNVIVSYVGTRVTVKATRPIPAGGQVFNCYGPHFVRMGKRERRDALRRQYYFDCNCEKCLADDSRVEVEEEGSPRQIAGEKGGAKNARDKSRALKCTQCDGPMKIANEEASFRCTNCQFSPGYERTEELKQIVGDLLKKKKALKESTVTDIDERSAASLVNEAEWLLYENNVYLAEIYDFYAFFQTNRDNPQIAFAYVKKSGAIVKTVYGDASVEFAYELRKLGELAMRLGDIRTSLDATRRSKTILETNYSAQHGDVVDLAETLKQLEIVERANNFLS